MLTAEECLGLSGSNQTAGLDLFRRYAALGLIAVVLQVLAHRTPEDLIPHLAHIAAAEGAEENQIAHDAHSGQQIDRASQIHQENQYADSQQRRKV